ncbi:MAG: lipopolysaccharide heptosyltransferase II [Phycisphaerales bacterium]
MSGKDKFPEVRRLLVVLPSWVGDVVMATPTLRALRGLYPDAQITALVKQSVKPVIDAYPFVDRIMAIRQRPRSGAAGPVNWSRRRTFAALAARLKARHFDAAVLLPNSFRAALLARLAQVPRRIGYDRDGRGFLLTDRLLAIREAGKFVPTSAVNYYLGLAKYLGAEATNASMQLFTRPADDAAADQLLRKAGVKGDARLVMLNPGANYGDAKMWPASRFAETADRLIERQGVTVLVNGSPKERKILDEVHATAKHALIDLPKLGNDLTLLKSMVKRCELMVTNDTGPRHIAAAFGVPVVTVFGPTDPRWSQIDFGDERIVRVDVFCGPCQKKICPLDHRCMTGVSAEMVVKEAEGLMGVKG